MRRTVITLATTVYALAILDLATTHLGMGLGAAEANPFMVGIAGTGTGVAVKLLGTPLVLTPMAWLGFTPLAGSRGNRLAVAILAVVVIGYIWTVVTNGMVIVELAQDAYCDGYRDAWVASGDPHLSWQTVDGCSGL